MEYIVIAQPWLMGVLQGVIYSLFNFQGVPNVAIEKHKSR